MATIISKMGATSKVMSQRCVRGCLIVALRFLWRFLQELTRQDTTQHNPAFSHKLGSAVKTTLTIGAAGSPPPDIRRHQRHIGVILIRRLDRRNQSAIKL